MKTKAITLEKITQYVLIFIISAIMTMIGNCINTVTDGNPDTYVSILEGIPGLLILIAIAFAGNLLGWLVPKIPAVLWITIIGILLGMPYNTVTAPFCKRAGRQIRAASSGKLLFWLMRASLSEKTGLNLRGSAGEDPGSSFGYDGNVSWLSLDCSGNSDGSRGLSDR